MSKIVLYWETYSKKIRVPDRCPTEDAIEMEEWLYDENIMPEVLKDERDDIGIANVDEE